MKKLIERLLREGVSGYEDLRNHVGHDVVVVMYGDGDNVAIECETDGEVLLDFNRGDSFGSDDQSGYPPQGGPETMPDPSQ